MRRVRGFIDLAFDAVEETTNLVERTHDAAVRRTVRRYPPIVPVTAIQQVVSRGVFASIRGINGLTRVTVNAAARTAEAVATRASAPRTPSRSLDHLQASVNGVWGDRLNRRGSALDLGMSIYHDGRSLPATPATFARAFPDPTPDVCIFVHGLATTERLWFHGGFGERLRDDLAVTPIYVRYNTGRPVVENGRALDRLLADVLATYPVPVERIAIVGHSMGGLVARGAAHRASERRAPWVERLDLVACLGSPHDGAPLAQAAHRLGAALERFEAAGARVPAELLASRSAGIRDLRHGAAGVPPVAGVRYAYLVATITSDPAHPFGRLVGDLLVRVSSASGRGTTARPGDATDDVTLFTGMNHFDLVRHTDVYAALRERIRGAASRAGQGAGAAAAGESPRSPSYSRNTE